MRLIVTVMVCSTSHFSRKHKHFGQIVCVSIETPCVLVKDGIVAPEVAFLNAALWLLGPP